MIYLWAGEYERQIKIEGIVHKQNGHGCGMEVRDRAAGDFDIDGKVLWQ